MQRTFGTEYGFHSLRGTWDARMQSVGKSSIIGTRCLAATDRSKNFGYRGLCVGSAFGPLRLRGREGEVVTQRTPICSPKRKKERRLELRTSIALFGLITGCFSRPCQNI